jgi:cytoskeletal protein RodZ
LEKLGQRRDPFVSHLRLLIGALMILVAAAWSFVMFYPQRRNVTESAVAQREKSPSRTAETHSPRAEPRRFENKAVEKKPSQSAPASIPNLAVAENERRNELANTKRPDDSPSVSKAESPTSEEIYRVSGASFVRNKPTANAEIIDTLQPGVRIAIIDRFGEYYRVSSLGERTVFGFVHKEDAFFERVQ